MSAPSAWRFYRGRRSLLVFVWFVLGAYVLFPALQTLSASFVDDGNASLRFYKDFFSARDFAGDWSWLDSSRSLSQGLQALYGSLFVSFASVFLAAAVGIPLAFFLERNQFPGRAVVAALLFLPLALPPVVGVVSFDLLFSESGMIPRGLAWLVGLDRAPFYLSGKGGVVAIHAYSLFPFFYLLVSNGIRDMDGSLIEASRSLGMGRVRTLLKVEAPMLTPALLGASLMVFMISMASFSAPLLFDVDGMYLSTHIYNLKNQNLMGEAYTATTLFAAASLGMLLLLRRLRGKRQYRSVGKGAPRKRRPVSTRWGRCLAGAAGFCLLLVVALPHLTVLLWSFTRDGSWTYQILPPEYTFENYARLLGSGGWGSRVFEPIRNSLWMAGLATLANLGFGIAAAYVLKARGTPGKAAVDLMVMLPWALPGTVIAINLIGAFSGNSPLSLGINLSGTALLLPMAYFIRNLPLVVRPLIAAWERYGEDLEEAARSLGSGRLRTLRTVSLPLVFPSLVAGGMLAFVTALGEFVASAVLYTPRNKPIAMAIYSEFHSGAYGICSAYGILLILLIVGVMMAGRKSLRGPAL